MEAPANTSAAPPATHASTFRAQSIALVPSGPPDCDLARQVLRGKCSRYEDFVRTEMGYAFPVQSGTKWVTAKLFQHKAPPAPSPNPFVPPPPDM